MKIIHHFLCDNHDNPYPYFPSPNYSDTIGGAPISYDYLIIHYTAGRNPGHAINWFLQPYAKASAHLVIARDGSISQCVPFDKIAWHAGISHWNDLFGLNRYSISIELDNAGRLDYRHGQYISWFGVAYTHEDVVRATHKHEGHLSYWHEYTPQQIEVALEVSATIMHTYDIPTVLGHDDIAPGRKVDPGPAFPMFSFSAKLQGRKDGEPTFYLTTTHLNIRTGPGVTYDKLPGSPLPPDTHVTISQRQGVWAFVKVHCTDPDLSDLEGWVHSYYLKPEEA